MKRDAQLIALREQVVFDEDKGLEMESFQASSLRPILKFQNEALILLFKKMFKEPLSQLLTLPKEALYIKISTFVRKEAAFRNTLKGMVIGQMTAEELNFYFENEAELNKRIYTMTSQRICDQISK